MDCADEPSPDAVPASVAEHVGLLCRWQALTSLDPPCKPAWLVQHLQPHSAPTCGNMW